MIDRIEQWLTERRRKAAQRDLTADRAWRRETIGEPYRKRREAALKATRKEMA